MKFSTILTPAFFALFIFINTTTVSANSDSHLTNVEVKSIDKEDVHEIITLSGRAAEVRDTEATNRRSASYTMRVKVMKDSNVMAEAVSNSGEMTLELSHLPAGTYVFAVTTPDSTSYQFVTLD